MLEECPENTFSLLNQWLEMCLRDTVLQKTSIVCNDNTVHISITDNIIIFDFNEGTYYNLDKKHFIETHYRLTEQQLEEIKQNLVKWKFEKLIGKR